jgi:hypothetical protein
MLGVLQSYEQHRVELVPRYEQSREGAVHVARPLGQVRATARRWTLDWSNATPTQAQALDAIWRQYGDHTAFEVGPPPTDTLEPANVRVVMDGRPSIARNGAVFAMSVTLLEF